MKKVIVTTLGILLASSAVSSFAAKQDRENLALCKSDINAYYGDSTRMRLRSIKRDDDATHMRLMVNPKGGSNIVVVCSIDTAGVSSLETRDGIALTLPAEEQKDSVAE